jgi:HSP20 family protein
MTSAPTNNEEKKQQLITPSKEVSPLHTLQHEMNRLFEEFKSGLGWSHPVVEQLGAFHAKIDMKDNDKEVLIHADLPGVELKDIQISVEGNSLVLQGEKKVEKESKEKGYYRMERSYGSFYRSIPLPCAIEQENIDAVYKDGVLNITLPKSKDTTKPEKRITVKAG